ncbi:MAG: phosphoenolpyruvate carboxykinase (GTP) [Thermodesulfovibrionales bacterium]|nr:phosphoenolpyruvate carboxykinase (GTP) [Thermodesulfovibrionales bacterium]
MATEVEKWVEEQAKLTKPDKIYWCNGSDEEAQELLKIGMTTEKIGKHNTFYELNHKLYPNAYLHRSHPSDVARVEHLTFVNQPTKEIAGPNNNWMEPNQAKTMLHKLFDGCMKGRTMYVLPYTMGHPDSPFAKNCIQLTDSVYVAVSMKIMTRMSKTVLDKIGNSDNFVKGLHSIGELDPKKRFIMHFPQESLVMSIGSGYGGNALLGKKCFSLRIASQLALKENWLAEHMIIAGIEEPDGNITYITGAFPSACGKTNLAMMSPSLANYKLWTIGDDIAWINFGKDKKLYAINPESGFFGVAPDTSYKTNPNMMETLKSDKFFPTLFTNTALDPETNTPWWEGMERDNPIPKRLIDWQGNEFVFEKGRKAAHPNSRFTVSIYNAPTLSKEFDNPAGVPISAILFGSRRSRTIPLVLESFDWNHGVFCAATMGSETTAAAALEVGVIRRDPFAMLPFCGYNMADYFAHWLNIGSQMPNPPKIFMVNWFRVDENGKFLWPGFRENIRVIKWILDRVHGRVGAKETPIGLIPNQEDLDLSGLTLSQAEIDRLFKIDTTAWQREIAEVKDFFEQFGDRLPEELWKQYNSLKKRLGI